ncbi:PepSY-associated TM helix domain-containing protein [Moorena producens JHB]|uniref:PepSY-associated TM helix domain-containing protein n=1 Tax=Moorena producens (strain JHB) TaxID=1454205 RepID=A0A1D9G040_MOOP1|nr:PepSY-associated TM helix domain-containing protein [Moorena producens]AOY80976.1 PepSY-associated TM helix domain-containing protein [Moorena producens JHB]
MNQPTLRKLHSTLAPIILLPFMITAITGIAYRLGRSWFGLSKDQAHFLMVIHEGRFLGDQLRPIYVLLNGLGLIFMLVTGIVMYWKSIRKKGLFSSKAMDKNTAPDS